MKKSFRFACTALLAAVCVIPFTWAIRGMWPVLSRDTRTKVTSSVKAITEDLRKVGDVFK